MVCVFSAIMYIISLFIRTSAEQNSTQQTDRQTDRHRDRPRVYSYRKQSKTVTEHTDDSRSFHAKSGAILYNCTHKI